MGNNKKGCVCVRAKVYHFHILKWIGSFFHGSAGVYKVVRGIPSKKKKIIDSFTDTDFCYCCAAQIQNSSHSQV